MTGTGGRPPVRILAIVVLYKMALTESETLTGLRASFAAHPDLGDSLRALVWDNSPEPAPDPELPPSFAYRHSGANVGVSGAYNQAMRIAEETGCDWMLLLDQDTEIPSAFLPGMLDLASRFLKDPAIGAVVPFLLDGERFLSPQRVLFKRFKPLDRRFEGVWPGEVTAANSGTLIRTSALRQIGGYNEDFWLGYSDVWVFHQLHLGGKKVYIAGDLALKHRISVSDFKNEMSRERYLNSIASEGAYWDLCGTLAQRAFHTLRTVERGIRQIRHPQNSVYAGITLRYFLRRLFHSRKRRLRWWRRQSVERNIPVYRGTSSGG